MATYHNRMILGFVRSNKTAQNESVVVYLKQSSENNEYGVRVKIGNTRILVKQSYSLSTALREFAETIGQFTDGFSTWSILE